MLPGEELTEFAERLDAMLPRFTHSSSGLHMNREDEREFRRIVLEAKIILDDEFGRLNDFSQNVVQTANEGVANFVGSPSYHSVEGVEGILRAAVNQINRLAAKRGDGDRIPAANRYVTLSDNQREPVLRELVGLKEEARGANDITEEDRLIALSEIAAFEQTISQPRVATDLIQRFVDTVLKWMTNAFSAAALAEVAQRLIQALLKLVGA